MSTNIIDHFNENFEMVPAFSDDLKNEVYKLRYQVYCIENKFENWVHHTDSLEFDDFDQLSVHFLIRHRKSGDYAGTTRLILPDANNPERLFPLELLCEINNIEVMQTINREHLGEVSRFCVSKAFKKRRNEANTLAPMTNVINLHDHSTQAEQRTFPYFSLALIACVIKASYENDIHYLYATSEPAWSRYLSILGINFIKIGPLAAGNYHGERYASVIKIADMLDCVAKKNLDIWNLFTDKGRICQAKPREARQLVRYASSYAQII